MQLSKQANRLRNNSATWAIVINANNNAGQYWFTDSTMSFFNSRLIGNPVHAPLDSRVYYFVSSDRMEVSDEYPALYTVRRISTDTGEVSNVSEFQEYSNSIQAINAMLFVAGKPAIQRGRPRKQS